MILPHELAAAALDQAERSEPAVKAAALLRVARVLDSFDHADAERVLARGIAEAEALPEPERRVILAQAVSLAAAVSPKRALRLAESVPDSAMPGGVVGKALYEMVEHGHMTDAVDYLANPTGDGEYPHDAAMLAMARSDDAARLRIFRAAIAALRPPTGGREGYRRRLEWRFFSRWWTLLPADEARNAIGDIVRQILSEPDGPIHATVQDVRFSSTREHRLFEMLGPLRHLDPDLAESLIATHPQLAAAAATYPYGHESISEAARQRSAAAPPSQPVEQPSYIAVGRRLIPIPDAIRTNFDEPFAAAMRAYAVDTNAARPNDAPQECWPSTQEFRNILFQAGKHEGDAAIRHLDRIPDATLRLFAQIELAAALAGLPHIGGMSITPGPHGFRGSWELERRAAQQAAPSPLPPPQMMRARMPAARPNVPPSLEARIAPTRHAIEDGPSGGSGPDYWTIENAPLKQVVTHLFAVPATRIDCPDALDSVRYDFALVLPRTVTRETMRRLMREGVERHFRVTRERRSVEVDIITAPRGIKAPEAVEDGLFGSGSVGFAEPAGDASTYIADARLYEILSLHMVPSEIEDTPEEAMHAMRSFLVSQLPGPRPNVPGAVITSIADSFTIEELCRLLEQGVGRPVIDETRLTGRYAVNVQSEPVSARAFLQIVCDALGLVARVERRDIELLVLRPK